jgi:hypothetical protein
MPAWRLPSNFAGYREREMNEQFHACPVDRETARAAYPLVYLHDASVSLPLWLRFARRISRTSPAKAGLIVIRDCRDIIHALFSYRVGVDLHMRKRLSVDHLIVAHTPGSQIEDAVVASTSTLAANLGCDSTTIEQPFHPRRAGTPKYPTAERLRSASGGDVIPLRR